MADEPKVPADPAKSNVLSLLPKEKKEKRPKPEKTQVLDAYAQAVAGDYRAMPSWKRFPWKLHAVVDEAGLPRVLEETAGEVLRLRADRAVTLKILNYSRSGDALPLSSRDANEVLQLWYAAAEPLDEETIRPVRELGEPGLCWHRLPFDLATSETPTFDEIMSRMSNARAFMAWVGSLFVWDSDRQQYVWVYGGGRNSKGALARFLHAAFGPSYRAETVPDQRERFWTSGLIGSRIVVFADCSKYYFPTQDLFKSLTGDDAIRMERKNEASFTAKIHAKFLFLSNDYPELQGSTADFRRAIYCELKALDKETNPVAASVYQRRLWAEGAAWLWKCREIWGEMTVGGANEIPVETEATQSLAANANELFATTWERYFVKAERHGLKRDWAHVKPIGLQTLYAKVLRWDGSQVRRWQRWLKMEFAVESQSIEVGPGVSERRWVGMTWSENGLEALSGVLQPSV